MTTAIASTFGGGTSAAARGVTDGEYTTGVSDSTSAGKTRACSPGAVPIGVVVGQKQIPLLLHGSSSTVGMRGLNGGYE